MTAKSKKSKADSGRSKARLDVEDQPEKSKERNLADVSLDPAASGMTATRMFNAGSFGEQDSTELYLSLSDKGKAAASGDLTHYKAMLAAQADTLNSVFSELARRAALNMGEYISATEIYMRLALKSQAQCKANIEALDRHSIGRVQTVRHVQVNEGGQAVIADEFHHHTGVRKNGKSNEQPPATGTTCKSPAMLSQDAQGDGVPISSGEWKQAMSNARR